MLTDFPVRELGLLPHLASRRQALARSSAGFGLAALAGILGRQPPQAWPRRHSRERSG